MLKGESTAGTILLSGVLGGVLVFLIEVIFSGIPSAFLGTLAAAILVALGTVVGLWIWIVEFVADRLQLAAGRLAALRAFAAAPLLVFATWRLFEGSYAQTLIDPTVARALCPLLGVGALWLLFWVLLKKPVTRFRHVLAMQLAVVLAIASHFASHSELGRGYPDQLVAASALGLFGAALFFIGLLSLRPATTRLRLFAAMGISAASLVALVLTVGSGASTAERRWQLALHHGHAAHWVALARRAQDSDGDGFSTFFGGGDCNDANPDIHPSAADIADNGIDENCDGVDALSAAIELPDQAGYDEQIATWLESSVVTAFLSKTRKMDIVVVFVDTLRADLLTDTDANRTDFPRLFELLDQSRRFELAFSPAAGTDVAMASLLTGRIDPFVRVKTTLFEAMGQSGHAVYGVLPGEVLRWAGTTLIRRGLDIVAEIATDRDKPDHGSHSASLETTEKGLQLLREHQGDNPVFLWLHYFDVHEHLQLPSGTPSIVGLLSSTRDAKKDRVAKYRATFQLVDKGVGVLLDSLKNEGRWENTIVILASDHGESMLEDPRLPKAHGLYVYNPLTHVPLAIRIPGNSPGAVQVPVALTDLTPTLTALTGATGLEDTEAHTLLHHLVDDDNSDVSKLRWPILLHEQNQWGIIDWPFKLMVRPQDNLKELYNLKRDFAELSDLSFVNPEQVRALEYLRRQYPAFQVVRTMDIIRQREGIAEAP